MAYVFPHRLQRVFRSGGTVFMLALAAVSILIISDHFYVRTDLTRDRRYTLAAETRQVLQQIKSPVTIHFYYSRTSRDLPVPVKDFARRVEDLLHEYTIAAGPRLIIRKVDVSLQSDTEDAARTAGIEPQLTPDGTGYYYLGLDIDCVDQSKTLAQLLPSQESVLEYDLTRAIQQVHNPRRERLGILSALAVDGPKANNPFRVRSQRRAWMFLQDLREDYDVQVLKAEFKKISASIDLLLLVHPPKLSAAQLYGIDQFLLRGGRLIVLLDPYCVYDARGKTMGGPGLNKPSQSDLGPLLKAWGIDYNPQNMVVDLGYAFRPPQGIQPAFLEIDKRGLSAADPTTAALEKLLIPYAGTLHGTPASGLNQTVLIQSSKRAWLVNSKQVEAGLQYDRDLKETEAGQYTIALKLNGNFTSAFPKPPQEPADPMDEDPARPHLAASKTESAVILMADADFLWNELWLERRVNPYNQKTAHIVTRDNNKFLQNAVDQLSGATNLIRLRSRSVSDPKFTRVQDLRQKTAEAKRREMAKIQQAIAQTRQRLIAIAQVKKGVEQWIESPEERAEREQLNRKLAELKENRIHLDRRLNAEINQLGERLMWLNVGFPPLIVILFGLAVWVRRKF